MAGQDLFRRFKVYASLLPVDYQTVNVNVMADAYCKACDANDEVEKNKYISGLMLRFWYTIKKMQEKSPGLNLDLDDFADWLYEAIEYACKYRKWQDPINKVNAQQAINQCIETIRLQHYYEMNLDKHKVNYQQDLVRLDAPAADNNSRLTVGDILEDTTGTEELRQSQDADVAEQLVQEQLDHNKVVEAIILDTIAFNDVYKDEKTVINTLDDDGNPQKYTKHSLSFWPFKCIQILSSLPENFADTFAQRYDVDVDVLNAAVNKIRKSSNQKLYRYLDKTLEQAKQMM